MLYDKRWELDQDSRIMLDAAQVLRERGHCKYALEYEGRVCLVGAIATVMTGSATGFQMVSDWSYSFPHEIYARLLRRLGTDPVSWNNDVERTGDEVIAVLEAEAGMQTDRVS